MPKLMNLNQRCMMIMLCGILFFALATGCKNGKSNSTRTIVVSTTAKANLLTPSNTIPPILTPVISTTAPKTITITSSSEHLFTETTITPSSIGTTRPIPTGFPLNFAALPEINGILYLGNPSTGTYNKVDFIRKKTWLGAFNPQCTIFFDGEHVFCDSSPNDYILDLVVKKYVQLPEGHWFITPSEKLLYNGSTDQEGLTSTTIWRVEDGSQQEIPSIGEFGWNSFPQLSDDGKYFLGVGSNIPNSPNSLNQIALFDTTELKTQIVYQNETPWPTDDVAWANNEEKVAIGGEDETITNEIGSCPNYVLVYDVVAQKTQIVMHLPDKKCFDMFLLHGTPYVGPNNNIWSPNNQYIALLIQQQDICIIEVDTGNYECHTSDVSWGTVRNIAWSPDSEWIAYNTSENHVILFSMKNEQFTDFGDMGNLNVGWLVWTTVTE